MLCRHFNMMKKKLYKRIANINVMMAIQLGMEVNGN